MGADKLTEGQGAGSARTTGEGASAVSVPQQGILTACTVLLKEPSLRETEKPVHGFGISVGHETESLRKQNDTKRTACRHHPKPGDMLQDS